MTTGAGCSEAVDVPRFELGRSVTPSHTNPLGVKVSGAAGTIESAQTMVGAVALRRHGGRHIETPLRPKRVRQAIQDAKQDGSVD